MTPNETKETLENIYKTHTLVVVKEIVEEIDLEDESELQGILLVPRSIGKQNLYEKYCTELGKRNVEKTHLITTSFYQWAINQKNVIYFPYFEQMFT